MEEAEPKKTPIKWIAVGIVIGIMLIVALATGFWMGSRSPSQDGNEINQNQLTIASFVVDDTFDEPEIQAYLDLEIHNYWVENNTVRCTGQVEWHTTDYTLDGLAICMYIKENQTRYKSVDVKVVAYGGLLLLPHGVIDSDSVHVPKLGEDLFKFDFSLSCTYQ